jgi:hypothetical protein
MVVMDIRKKDNFFLYIMEYSDIMTNNIGFETRRHYYLG